MSAFSRWGVVLKRLITILSYAALAWSPSGSAHAGTNIPIRYGNFDDYGISGTPFLAPQWIYTKYVPNPNPTSFAFAGGGYIDGFIYNPPQSLNHLGIGTSLDMFCRSYCPAGQYNTVAQQLSGLVTGNSYQLSYFAVTENYDTADNLGGQPTGPIQISLGSQVSQPISVPYWAGQARLNRGPSRRSTLPTRTSHPVPG